MFGLPAPTQFDIRFSLLGIPVRVNPLFWVLAAFLGWQTHARFQIFLWIACVFVSVLVHELGHALTARAMARTRPSILLYYIGGVCTYEGEGHSPWRRIFVLIMGPGAGFLFFGLVTLVSLAVAGVVRINLFFGLEPIILRVHELPRWYSAPLLQLTEDLLEVNLLWGLFNLLPIYPLDGGQIMGVLLTMRDKWEGPRWGYLVSMVVAGGLALVLYARKNELGAIMPLMLAFFNFQLWQVSKYQGAYGNEAEDDDDWWKR